MPHTLLLYRDGDDVPVLDWLASLERQTIIRNEQQLSRLADTGHNARRPLVENLGQGIYELRTRVGRVNYRILFSFYGRNAVLLSSGFTKEREIPPEEIRRARDRLQEFLADPVNHYLEFEL